MADTRTPELDLIGSTEAASVLAVHVATIARWAADGTIPVAARLTGKTNPLLFHRTDVQALAERRQTAVQAEAGHAYPVLVHLCLALAVVTLLAAALPAQALAFVTGGALAVVVSGTATLAVGVVRTLRALDDHP